MKNINQQSTASQKFFHVCSKRACAFDDIGVWAFNKTEAKQAFKARNPEVPFNQIQAVEADE